MDTSPPAPSATSEHASRTLSELALETRLGDLPRKTPIAVAPATPLAEALATMHERHIGSLLVLDEAGAAVGILTRHDIIGRVTLPQLPLATPISEVMSRPVSTLTVRHTAHDAALLMSRLRIRHLPLTEDGRVVSVVSARDLFAMQRLSLRQLSSAIRGARDIPTLAEAAEDIRRFARALLTHGVGARQLTQLISHLNDVLTERVVQLLAEPAGIDMGQACWLAFGSEGRSEQTIATDQDNGLVFLSDDPERDRPLWLAFGRSVNAALDACGYPLCKGKVMAGEPDCCMTPDEWTARFRHWMEHGAPKDLLQACIFFDFRPLTGRADLVAPMRELVTLQAARLPRFMKQMAENALSNRAPLGWLGGVETQKVDGRAMLDLKFHGSMIFVDAARLYALAAGVPHTGTRERFEAVAKALHVQPHESEAWVSGFEYLQTLRLRVQLDAAAATRGNPNLIDLDMLNDIDRQMLKETLRVGRRLQQRMELDYRR